MIKFSWETRFIVQFFAVFASIVFAASVSRAQVKIQKPPAAPQTQPSFADEISKNPELLKEFGNLINQFQRNIQYPGPRSESRLLPLLPASTMFYGAFPNYGQASDQVLKILRQELQDSSAFRNWWHQGDMAATGLKLEDALKKFSELNDFLGQEIVVSGVSDGRELSFVFVAEVHKPGLKKYLQQMLQDLAGNAKPPFRVFDPQELATAVDKGPSQDAVILVRPDFVVAAKNVAVLRSFSARLDQPGREFPATPFGKRVAQEYRDGVTVVAAADLQGLINQAPPATKQNVAFQQSGFADAKYLVWETRRVDGKSVTQFELSFNAPRRGAAAWLAKSGPLNSLDFVSPDAILSASLLLSNPAQIFDEVRGLVSLSNPKAFAALPMFEQALHLSVKDDVLGQLRGDVTLELDSATPPLPGWRVILGVKDADHLQRSLNALLSERSTPRKRLTKQATRKEVLPRACPRSAPIRAERWLKRRTTQTCCPIHWPADPATRTVGASGTDSASNWPQLARCAAARNMSYSPSRSAPARARATSAPLRTESFAPGPAPLGKPLSPLPNARAGCRFNSSASGAETMPQ